MNGRPITGRAQWADGVRALRRFDRDTLLSQDDLRAYFGISRTTFYRRLYGSLAPYKVRGASLWRAKDVEGVLRRLGLLEGVR